ncbi:hypothetical protein ACEWY4_021724 [Coilia grayii]|uniref:G-protein coupled receptors family 3 profile domain-containing protein n=1 Tax=Coilia grayii TaxID=363190 RepID=A0ABD1J791_9TELE
MWIHLLSLVLLATLVHASQMDNRSSQIKAYAPGDVIIGILHSAHSTVDNLQDRVRPEEFKCSCFDLYVFARILAAIYTIDSINDSGFLPGVRLGYAMYDACADATKALSCVEHMLSTNGSFPVMDDYSEFRPQVKAILGEQYSLLTIPVAKLLSVYLFPQISATASAVVLSDKLQFPGFFRVIPNDAHQTEALAQIIRHFGWNWVGLVSLDDEYGKGVHQSFLKNAIDLDVCVAYEKVIPHYLHHEEIKQRIKEVAKQIQDSSDVKVVLVILRPQHVDLLFKEMIHSNTSRVWIASDTWARSTILTTVQDINKVGDIFGLDFITANIPGFDHYLQNLTVRPGVRNDLIEKYKQVLNHTYSFPENCSEPSADSLEKSIDLPVVFGETVAIWCIAHALRDLLECNETSCPGDTNFPPYKLVEKLQKVNFTLNGENKFFNDGGDFEDGYDVLMWVPDGESRRFEVIGRYTLQQRQVEISSTNIIWTMTTNNTTPVSQCSSSCKPGSFKKVSKIFCCYECIDCVEGTFTTGKDEDECHLCPNGTWSLKGWSKCEERTEEFLKWSQPYSIALLVGVIIGLLLLITSFCCFIVKRHALIIVASNLLMSCFMMLGLVVSFVSVLLFMDKPTIELCRGQQIMYALGFTFCVSCILVKAFHTFLNYMGSDPVKRDRLQRFDKPVIIMVLVTSVQGIICVFWLIFDTPDVDNTLLFNHSMVHELQCSEGSKITFGVMHSYIALLAFICFLLAFKGRQVPQDFNETGVIIFSMLIHLFAWLCFVPIYITKSESRPITQASAILVSNYGIIFCLLLPKCYQAIWGKHTTEQMRTRLHKFSEFRSRTSVDSGQCSNDEDRQSGSEGSVNFTHPTSIGSETDSGFMNVSMRHLSLASTSLLAEEPLSVLAAEGPTALVRLGTAVRHRLRSRSM